jgi:hypothetical protein
MFTELLRDFLVFKLVSLLFAFSLLAACSPGADTAGEQAALNPEASAAPLVRAAEVPAEPASTESVAQAPAPADLEIIATPLDLSLPDIAHFELSQTPDDFRPRKFDTGSLFNKQKDDPVSFSVKPNLLLGETLLSLPAIDGGSVSVEVKTK